MSWVPRSCAVEWNITYRCDLRCTACCRYCYLPPQTPDMTLEDAERFMVEANELKWKPEIWILGGEPTLHKDFLDFVRLACTFESRIRVISNLYRPKARELWAAAEKISPCCWRPAAAKPFGSVDHFRRDYCVAPKDFGVVSRRPCAVHAGYRRGCGICVDHVGYAICPNGGAIDAIHRLGLRVHTLKELFDPAVADWQTDVLCGQYCGCGWQLPVSQIGVLKEYYNAPASPTWQEAFDRIAKEGLNDGH